jgi:hypothetical protein
MAASLIKALNRIRIDDDNTLTGDASDKLTQLIREVRHSGKSGTLTLSLTVKPDRKGRAITINGKAAIKAPVADPESAVFFTNDDGDLLDDDLRQQRLPLEEVSTRRPIGDRS